MKTNSASNAFASFRSRVSNFAEPPINRRQQFARLLHLALVAPKACEAHCGAEFPRSGLLLAGELESTLKILFRLHGIALRGNQSDFPQDFDTWLNAPPANCVITPRGA